MNLILCALLISLSVPAIDSQDPSTDAKKPTIKDFAWIAGHWKGEAMGGVFEETWNPPLGNSMVGMFKLVKNNEVVFYEILTIVEEKNSVVLRLKHFDKGLAGWEEKDKSVEFPFISVSDKEAVFAGLKFQRTNDDSMNIVVQMKEGGKTSDLTFRCKKLPRKSKPRSSASADQRSK